MPGMPSTPTAVETGASLGSILVSPLPSESAWVCQPARDSTMSPLAKPGLFEAITSRHRAAFHHAADRHRRRIGRPVAHAPAHIGIERQPDRAQQDLALAGRRHRVILDAEVGRLGLADGARDQNDALCRLGHGGFLRIFCFVIPGAMRSIEPTKKARLLREFIIGLRIRATRCARNDGFEFKP